MPDSFPSLEAKREFFSRMPPDVKAEWGLRKAKVDCDNPEHNKALAARAQKRMARVDSLAPDIRRVVYEYNLEVVQEFLNHGVKTAASIKHLIDTVVGADFPNGQNRFKLNSGPNTKRNPINDIADDDDHYFVIPKRKV